MRHTPLASAPVVGTVVVAVVEAAVAGRTSASCPSTSYSTAAPSSRELAGSSAAAAVAVAADVLGVAGWEHSRMLARCAPCRGVTDSSCGPSPCHYHRQQPHSSQVTDIRASGVSSVATPYVQSQAASCCCCWWWVPAATENATKYEHSIFLNNFHHSRQFPQKNINIVTYPFSVTRRVGEQFLERRLLLLGCWRRQTSRHRLVLSILFMMLGRERS